MAKDQPQEESSGAAGEKASGGLKAKLAPAIAAANGAKDWALANRIKAGLYGAGGLLGIVLLIVAGSFLTSAGDKELEQFTIEDALEALDHQDYERARLASQFLLKPGAVNPSELGGPVFVLGAVAMADAELAWDDRKHGKYLLAARYLEEARDRGFPAGRKADGLIMLGQSLIQSRQYSAARLALHEALEAAPKRSASVQQLLATAYLEDADPDLNQALEHNRAFLAHGTITPDELHAGLLQQATIQYRLGQSDAAAQALQGIPDGSLLRSERMILEARVLMAQARAQSIDRQPGEPASAEVAALYRKAIDQLRAASGFDVLENQSTAKSRYLIGVCYSELADRRAAVDQLFRVTENHPQTPEDVAATLLRADVLRDAMQVDEAVAAYKMAIATAGNPLEFSNPWITLDEFRRRILVAYDAYVEQGQYAAAVELAKGLTPIFAEDRALLLEAVARRRWGLSLINEAANDQDPQSNVVAEEGRAQLRNAGNVFFRVAQVHLTDRDYPDDLWNAADSYLQGHDFENAVKISTKYLSEGERHRRPLALLGMGRALLSLDRPEEALIVLGNCIEFHPLATSTYQARQLASLAYMELDKPAEAEQMLLANLTDQHLTPSSLEWQTSIFELGRLYYLTGRYPEAITRLEEAIARYPDSDRVLEARYLAAESYRRYGLELSAPPGDDVPPSSYAARASEASKMLATAAEQYVEVRRAVLELEAERLLSLNEQRLLRNTYFAQGQALSQLERWQAAIDIYTAATNRYQRNPEALEAYVQIANCYRQMGQPLDARGTLEQAKIVLSRLPEDALFTASTNYNRLQWQLRLDRLSTL